MPATTSEKGLGAFPLGSMILKPLRGGLQARLPHSLAKAVALFPEKMYDFVSYAYDSIQDPHSDYAVQMQTVCRHHHERFMTAVNQMPEKDRNWFAAKIFDTARCRAIALPEAD